MKINLLKKELVVGIIFLLIFSIIPYVTSNNLTLTSYCENNLMVTLTTDKIKYNVGEPVEITICVTNMYTENITLVFPDTQLADFTVKNDVNETIYLWSHNKYFYQVETYVTVPRGETVELLNDKWEQVDCNGNQVPIGDYIIDGWMVEYNIYTKPVGISIVIPEFDIDYRPWYIGELWFDIQNTGDVEIINISWRFEIEFTIAPPSKPPIWKGMIENLSVNEVERISSDWFIVGLGIHDITITLNASNAEEFIRMTRGFFFGPFIWIPKILKQ